jgi:hypothetical protein
MSASELLLLPNPKTAESVRGYMLRAAADNLFPRMFCNELKTFKRPARFIIQMSLRDRGLAEHLIARFAHWGKDLSSGVPVTRLGLDKFPASCLIAAYRQVCPLCLAQKAYCRLEWEVKSIQACPTHRVTLVNACPSCGQPLRWHRSELTHCFCGQRLDCVETAEATYWQINWAKLIKSATYVSRMTLQPSKLAPMKVIPTRLSKLLLMADVVRRVLLPEHIDEPLNNERAWMFTAQILDDPPYSAYLWDAIFIYAAANPFTMAEILTPGRKIDAIAAAYKDLLPDLALPHALRELRAGRRPSVRPLKAAPFFDVRKHGVGPYRFLGARAGDDIDPFALVDDEEQIEEVWCVFQRSWTPVSG